MVTRRTRNYKEKKPMTTFGQFILPLTVIMAVALLFFSVKLFFFNANDPDDIVLPANDSSKSGAFRTVPAEDKQEPALPARTAEKRVDIKPAQPAAATDKETQKAGTAKSPSAGQANPVAAVKETTAGAEKTQPAPIKEGPRWDVQIGAFTSKDNALQLMEKARGQGHSVYLSEEKRDGSIFYKVRVRSPGSGRDEAAALSKKLESEGYPIFLVEVR